MYASLLVSAFSIVQSIISTVWTVAVHWSLLGKYMCCQCGLDVHYEKEKLYKYDERLHAYTAYLKPNISFRNT